MHYVKCSAILGKIKDEITFCYVIYWIVLLHSEINLHGSSHESRISSVMLVYYEGLCNRDLMEAKNARDSSFKLHQIFHDQLLIVIATWNQ